jgi:hypothetical protein
MNQELELITAFRAGVAEPDAQRTMHARAMLVRAMQPGTTPSDHATRARRRSWRVAGAVAAALAVALLAPALVPDRDVPPASAAEFLQTQARIAIDRPAVWPVQPSQFLYTERIEWNRECDQGESDPTWHCTALGVGAFTHQTWIAPDGSGRECFIGLEDATGPPCGDDAAGMLTPIDLSRLPSDAHELLARAEAGTLPGMRADSGSSDTDTIAGILGLLVQPTASPELRAGLYEAAAMVPGTELLGQVQDETGRSGTGIASTFKGTRVEVIFDPQTSDVLGTKTEQVATAPGDGSGTPLGVTNWDVFRTTAVVDAIGDRP